MNHYANVYYYSYTLNLSYYLASFQSDCNNLYATHLFNSSTDITQLHCTDGGTQVAFKIDVLFFSVPFYLLVQIVGQLY